MADDIFHEEEEQKEGNNAKKYKHTSSMYSKKAKPQTDTPDNPLARRNVKGANPIGEEVNNTGVPLDID